MNKINRLICFIFGHKYFLAQELTSHSRRMCCRRCSMSFAMNDDVRSLVNWGPEFDRLYENHGIEIKYLDFEYSKLKNGNLNGTDKSKAN